ncbi:hypothetical protein C4F50_19790 [Flavobacterium sp. KB82]|uniref:Uncharacterized protein n=1 Tax=Flavobacterium hungaricum TaxID=2082725 RepID=A0ABR9TPI5_9FLAO|nr:hypothetical protein [Flavobacterium hungaricum]
MTLQIIISPKSKVLFHADFKRFKQMYANYFFNLLDLPNLQENYSRRGASFNCNYLQLQMCLIEEYN